MIIETIVLKLGTRWDPKSYLLLIFWNSLDICQSKYNEGSK